MNEFERNDEYSKMYQQMNQNNNIDLDRSEENLSRKERRAKKKQEKRERRAERRNSVGRKVMLAAVYGLVFGLVAGGAFQAVNVAGSRFLFENKKEEAVTEIEEREDTAEEIQEEPEKKVEQVNPSATTVSNDGTYSVAQVAEMVMPSVVAITNRGVTEVQSWFGVQQQESESSGSGIIVGQNETELLIATNNHVVEGAEELSVCFNDNTEHIFPAQTKGTDASNDLAIIAIKLEEIPVDVLETIKIATIGDSDSLIVGEQIVAIGNALGYGQSVTSGYISALNRSVSIENITTQLIQIDAAINPGNSGGALINMKGEVIGINSAKFASDVVEGMGYAIPMAIATPILDVLENRETRTKLDIAESGYLGITCNDVSAEANQMYKMPYGVYVVDVTDGGAAQKAGVRPNDIIVRFDGLTISDVNGLKSNLLYYKAGETVELVVERMGNNGYEEVTLSVTLDRNPNVQNEQNDQNSQSQQTPGEGMFEIPFGFGY